MDGKNRSYSTVEIKICEFLAIDMFAYAYVRLKRYVFSIIDVIVIRLGFFQEMSLSLLSLPLSVSLFLSPCHSVDFFLLNEC